MDNLWLSLSAAVKQRTTTWRDSRLIIVSLHQISILQTPESGHYNEQIKNSGLLSKDDGFFLSEKIVLFCTRAMASSYQERRSVAAAIRIPNPTVPIRRILTRSVAIQSLCSIIPKGDYPPSGSDIIGRHRATYTARWYSLSPLIE